MACNLKAPCPYGKQCTDCLHNVVGRNIKTGLNTSDLKAYKREYMRRRREKELMDEMKRAGVA